MFSSLPNPHFLKSYKGSQRKEKWNEKMTTGLLFIAPLKVGESVWDGPQHHSGDLPAQNSSDFSGSAAAKGDELLFSATNSLRKYPVFCRPMCLIAITTQTQNMSVRPFLNKWNRRLR